MSRLFGALAFLIPLAAYWLTAAPGMTLIDSGELALSAWEPGVAHPPGFPLYVLVGFLFARLPLAEAARNLNLLSALCGAAACWLVWLSARRLAGHDRGWTTDLAALSAALTFGFTFILWGFTSFTEVYTLNLALWAAAVLFLLRGLEGGEGMSRHFLVSALCWGLALAVHLGTVALTAPAFLFAGLAAGETRSWPTRWSAWRRLVRPVVTAVVTAGLLYATIALIAGSGPLFNWGDATSLQRFLAHISGKQYQSNLFSSSIEVMGSELLRIGRHVLLQGTPAALLAALWGAWSLWRDPDRRPLLVTLVLLVLFNVFYALAYEINEDKEAYYMVTFFCGALLLAAGAGDLLRRTGSRRGLRALVTAGLLLLPIVTFGLNVETCDRRSDRRADRLVRAVCEPLPEGSLLLTREWQFYSPWLYQRHVLGYRPDLRVVDVNLVRRSWYMAFLEREIPGLVTDAGPQKAAFLEQLALFEGDRPYDPGTIQRTFIEFFNGLIAAAHARGVAVHVMTPMESGVGAGCTPVPRGLTFRLLPPGAPRVALPEVPIREDDRWVYGPDDLAGRKLLWLHGEMLYWAGRHHAELGETGRARRFVERAGKIHPPGTPYPGH